ncbi:M15 family metallopeptidase [Kribbella sp. NPDC056345]|uniref:M15 family metallopeptidase n=1 Tax=Kribbella sp. NPDC056345 TaxID=3345789 RepID=UPI0035DB7781
MPTSQNGWSANDIRVTSVQTIPGTTRKVRLRTGDAGYLLTHFAAWFDKHVESIDSGQLDDWGYAERPIKGGVQLSNHASGTALDLNALRHPLAKRGTFTKAQYAAIRAQLKVYEGALRHGIDYVKRADEMHVEINASAAKVAAVARKLRGAPVPPATPPKDVTIKAWSIRYGCNQEPGYLTRGMRSTDATYVDIRQFLAWARRLGYTSAATERAWIDKASKGLWQGAANLLHPVVKNVQRKNHLVADGIFGPKTGAVLAKYGYKIT